MSEARCDICLFKNGHKGFKLMTCKKCSCHVHMECYGLTGRAAERFSNCFACKVINHPVTGITAKGAVEKVTEDQRPDKCELCSITGGIHAMHPLFNDHGEDGRQLILPNGKLAWVHSLCALTICHDRHTLGSVYGCDILGHYDCDGEENADSSNVTSDGPVSLHHFVMSNKSAEAHWRNMCEHRELSCIGCGKRDPHGMRIPVQCTAGDDGEFEEFSAKHCSMDGACYQAMHVGCARWHRNKGPYRRVFFFAGTGTVEPVVEVYCPKHARDLETESAPSGGLVREGSHTMVGFEKHRDADQLKHILEKGIPSHLALPDKSQRRTTKLVARTNLAAERRAKSQSVLGRSSSAGERESSTPSPQKKKSMLKTLPIAGQCRSGSIPKKTLSPALSKILQQKLTGIPQAPDLSMITAKKRSNKPVRSMGSNSAVTETTMIPQSNKRQPLLPTPAKDLPPPPAYQGTSCIAYKKNKNFKVSKKRKSVTEYIGDPAVDPFVDDHAPRKAEPVKKKAPRVRRRFLNESKTNDEDHYDDDFDWVGAMTVDMGNVIAMSKKDGNDLNEVVEARRYFWKSKSGIFSSDFIGIWSKVMEEFAGDVADAPAATTRSFLPDTVLEFNVDPDAEISGKNKWANMWHNSELLFEFGDWDTTKHQLKCSKELL